MNNFVKKQEFRPKDVLKLSRILVLKTVLMCAKHVPLCIRTLLRALQAGTKISGLPKNNLGHFMRETLQRSFSCHKINRKSTIAM